MSDDDPHPTIWAAQKTWICLFFLLVIFFWMVSSQARSKDLGSEIWIWDLGDHVIFNWFVRKKRKGFSSEIWVQFLVFSSDEYFQWTKHISSQKSFAEPNYRSIPSGQWTREVVGVFLGGFDDPSPKTNQRVKAPEWKLMLGRWSFPFHIWGCGPLKKGCFCLLSVSGSVFDLFKSNWLETLFDD